MSDPIWDLNRTLKGALIVWQEERDLFAELLDAVREIRNALTANNSPAGFIIKEQPVKGESMAKLKATVDLQILDDGKGVLFTLQPVNAAETQRDWCFLGQFRNHLSMQLASL